MFEHCGCAVHALVLWRRAVLVEGVGAAVVCVRARSGGVSCACVVVPPSGRTLAVSTACAEKRVVCVLNRPMFPPHVTVVSIAPP